MGRRMAVFPLCFVLGVFGSSPASGQNEQRDMEYEAQVIAELEAVAPDAVEDFRAATSAMDDEDYSTADGLFARVLDKAPGFDVAIRRRGYCLQDMGQRDEGIRLFEKALAIRRSPETLAALAGALAFPGGEEQATEPEMNRALMLIREASRLDPTDARYLFGQAQIALKNGSLEWFVEASRALSRDHEGEMATHYFAAIRSAYEQKWGKAESEIRKAGELGLSQEVVESFLDDTGIRGKTRAWRWARYMAIASGVWIGGLLLLFVVGKLLSAATLRSVERDDPNRDIAGAPKALRSVYRRVVNLSGLYYYVSLPFVALLVVGLTAAVFYGFWAAGRIPIKLVVVLGFGALATCFAIVSSLFVRVRDDTDPGRAVTEEEAPGLWAMAREVASEVRTRPVDEIWLTPGTDLAVFERGSLRKRMEDRGRRALLLGIGVLDGFNQNAFRAVLAHEYGHFTHRDTAGGDVALRVTSGMMAFARSLAEAGFAVWWNLGFQFLRVYDNLFRRITHGATRLQEVLADRVAVQRYGLNAFKQGLTHVVRRAVLFDYLVNTEINSALRSKRSVANLYELKEPADRDEKGRLDDAIEKALARPTSEYDTHPSPEERFRLAARITGGAARGADAPVWSLIRDPAGLKEEMTATIDGRVQAYAQAMEEAQAGG